MTFVLVVDDDPAICRTLAINLRARDYDVETAGDGRSALQIVDERMPDVVLLDLGLPDLDGITVLTRLRGFSQVPVIVVSARTGSDDKVEALDLGADDFITKPFSIEELLARVRAATRRAGAVEPAPCVRVGDLVLDLGDSRARRGECEIHLTPIEWRIVEHLVRRRGRLVRHAELLQSVWGPSYERQTNYLRVHLASIRRKVEVDPSRPVLFVTEPGMGYRFAPQG
ncbi:response regulator [Nocardioides sp. zg-DK7169]|uniref:response regulator n=1 Tax=Nocardioides sp. zg-DK7169 TaxID=2736600 RepID=UPI001554A356|nr:response regulator transcription factor [Nocardioides sp. zg-DK7169]NPC96505.1 response regulator transcription factor [Nocardioides sp. zg-DK7169]